MKTLELFDLSGRVGLVTGGGRGIGVQIATTLAELGAAVAICGRDEETATKTAATLAAEHGVPVIGLSCDVRSESSVEAAVGRVVDELGAIDILVNNAGTVWAGSPEEAPVDGWRKVVDVNLTGVYLVCRAAGRTMIERRYGKILNIASIAAFRGAPPEVMNAISYQATKGAVVSFTRDLACKWAQHNITVNAIAPGWFETDMTRVLLSKHDQRLLERTPLGRLGGPEDLKGTVALLASDASAWITGQTFVVDGGESAW